MSSRSRSRKRRAGSPPSTSADTKGTTKSTSTTPYNRNFQQNLIDHGVYPDGYEYPDGRIPAMPKNWEEINETLARPRPSLSPSKFSDEHFRKFKRADTHASKEQPVTTSVIPIIEGDVDDPKCAGGGYPLGNLAPLTDGALAQAKPDHLYGARPEQLDRQIRNELSDYIIPSTQDDLPMGWSMTSDPVTFRQGASAYRNARDWAKEKRDEFIRAANETHSKAQSQLLHSTSQSQTASEAALTLDDSDLSTLSDQTEYQDTQWSFANTTEEGRGESQILSTHAKKPRVGSVVQDVRIDDKQGCHAQRESITCTRAASLLGLVKVTRLCAAIDELPEFKPEELQQSEQSLSEATTGLSQEIGAVGLGSSFTSQLEEESVKDPRCEVKAQNQEFKEYKSQDIQGKCSYFTWDKSKVDRRWRAAREKWPIFDGGLSQFCARWFHDMHGHPSSGLPKTI
ncbi:predicted protein [Histoplasma mississippiense (nom. inval.)]|uniref:predicted protein n=1 Tax=Ajellomyces capsulatus (strain NAm1 / WU24) TaxID=2059318 RepID=UPI000157BD7B|nr:predicted protein [Histoplasma mississippiense (nom. inval.)]EDN06286.1 predicted protein [Histoplasma mississippiense (nom. inval.)]